MITENLIFTLFLRINEASGKTSVALEAWLIRNYSDSPLIQFVARIV